MEVLEEDMVDIIRNNGLTTSLYLSYVHNGLRNNSVNYSQLGALIGNNTHLTQLDIDVPHVPESQEANAWESDADESALADSRGFFEAIATNTSIEQLRLRAVSQSMFAPVCLGNVNLHTLELHDCNLGPEAQDSLSNLLQNKASKLQELVVEGGDFTHDKMRDALTNTNNTTLKKLHLRLNNGTPAWVCRNSSVEDLFLRYDSIGDPLVRDIAETLRDNITLKTLKITFGGFITEGFGWEALFRSLRNNTTLETLDFSDNELNDESLTCLMTVLSSNATLKTLRLESLRHITRDGWRTIAQLYLRSPTCALESLYMGHNAIDSGTFRELGSSCWQNKSLKNLCLTLPTSDRALNAPRCGWNPWLNQLTRIVWNKRSIIESYRSNHTLETICYPFEEERLERDLSTCETMAKNLCSIFKMNRGTQNKSALARRKILVAHYYDQENITENKRWPSYGYKTLIETILESTGDMETPQMLPHFMMWIGRDADGLPLMYELVHRFPLLCEHNAPAINKKRSRNEWMKKDFAGDV